MYQYIPIPPVRSCSSIGMYHEMFACKYTSIQATIHTNTTAKFPPQVLSRARIGMYFCVYLYELVCIWYVLVCIYDRLSTQVWGEHRWYWYVLCTYLPVFWNVFARIQWLCMCLSRICPYWGFWYCCAKHVMKYVLVCIHMYLLVLDRSGTYWYLSSEVCIGMYWYVFVSIGFFLERIDSKRFSTPPLMHHGICLCSSLVLEVWFSVCRMVRGKDHGPRIDVE